MLTRGTNQRLSIVNAHLSVGHHVAHLGVGAEFGLTLVVLPRPVFVLL